MTCKSRPSAWRSGQGQFGLRVEPVVYARARARSRLCLLGRLQASGSGLRKPPSGRPRKPGQGSQKEHGNQLDGGRVLTNLFRRHNGHGCFGSNRELGVLVLVALDGASESLQNAHQVSHCMGRGHRVARRIGRGTRHGRRGAGCRQHRGDDGQRAGPARARRDDRTEQQERSRGGGGERADGRALGLMAHLHRSTMYL